MIHLAAHPARNTTVSVPGVATIVLNKHSTASDGTLTVTAIYVSLLGSTRLRLQRGQPGASASAAGAPFAIAVRVPRRPISRKSYSTHPRRGLEVLAVDAARGSLSRQIGGGRWRAHAAAYRRRGVSFHGLPSSRTSART